MADVKKVLTGLECLITNEVLCGGCPYTESGYCVKNIAEDALELLKEQEPIIIRKDIVDEIYNYIAHCPECDMEWAMWHHDRMRFCPGCGKAVKWE